MSDKYTIMILHEDVVAFGTLCESVLAEASSLMTAIGKDITPNQKEFVRLLHKEAQLPAAGVITWRKALAKEIQPKEIKQSQIINCLTKKRQQS